LRYLLAVALATHAQVREGAGDPVLLELTGDGSGGLDPIHALRCTRSAIALASRSWCVSTSSGWFRR
jgi:hypothetical protein